MNSRNKLKCKYKSTVTYSKNATKPQTKLKFFQQIRQVAAHGGFKKRLKYHSDPDMLSLSSPRPPGHISRSHSGSPVTGEDDIIMKSGNAR